MKKFLVAVAVAVAASSAQAQQQISIIWPFGMGDTQAQYSRSLVEELNKAQKKYIFILENRPGAGATIGARHVATTPNTILSASTAFFVRPNFYPEDSHKVSDFQPLMTQCAAPMVIVSKKYKTWKEIDKTGQKCRCCLVESCQFLSRNADVDWSSPGKKLTRLDQSTSAFLAWVRPHISWPRR